MHRDNNTFPDIKLILIHEFDLARNKGTEQKQNYKFIQLEVNTVILEVRMGDRLPFCDPGKFGGNLGEDILSHITRFNSAALGNRWGDQKRKSTSH